MKLTSKIILSQLMVSLFVIILGIMLMPEVIYRNFKGTVRSNVSSYSSQIMSNISQKLVEIKRETNVLTADDDLKQKLPDGVVVLVSAKDGKVSLIVSASDSAVKKGAHAGNLIRAIAGLVGGGGGGRPTMAQAGGKNPDGIEAALAKAADVLAGQIHA